MTNRQLSIYVIGAFIVWAGIIAATAITLEGGDQFATTLIYLAAGAFWFIVLVPGWLRTLKQEDRPE